MTESLSLEQQHAFTKYRLGHNIFITGSGGTGKSYLIKTLKQDLESRGIKHSVCALTGCAAVLLNCYAKTIHSWSGIGLGVGTKEEIVEKAIRNKRATTNWKTNQVLIVDEISMMSLKVFEALDQIGKCTKRQYLRPFGGMQVIFIGDFYQLPPVGRGEEARFCFESTIWDQTFNLENHIQLKTLYRQKDPEYIRILTEVRDGVLTEESLTALNERLQATYDPSENNGIVPTKLFPRNADADRINQTMYAKIKEEEEKYDLKQVKNLRVFNETSVQIPLEVMTKCADLTNEEVEQQLKLFCENSNLNPQLSLKKGAIVMCLANLDTDAGVCNGSQGIVIDFIANTHNVKCPVVKFLNGVVMTIQPRVYQHGDYPKFGVVQIPLRLAWAFTIHKSQGVTLDIAEIDIGSSIFEFGQTYVALSRIRSLNGLYLSSFNPRKIKTNPTVSELYKKIPEITEELVVKTKETLSVFETARHTPETSKFAGIKVVLL
jgi:ATP-dependent DNA helicase PIF1